MSKTIVCGNGLAVIRKDMFVWLQRTGAKLHLIQSVNPTKNVYVESYNGKFRKYWLDLYWFANLEATRSTIDGWQDHYNHVRRHR